MKNLEMAPEIKSFLDGDYFRGMVEIAAAAATGTELYVPDENMGIFQSLYFKRVFARKENKNGSWTVGNFQLKNRYLYNYDKFNKVYTEKKDENFDRFTDMLKDIVENKTYKIFLLEPAKEEDLAEIISQ